jgi:hypothetical protein
MYFALEIQGGSMSGLLQTFKVFFEETTPGVALKNSSSRAGYEAI